MWVNGVILISSGRLTCSLLNVIFERDAFGIVFLESFVCSVCTGEDLEVVDVTDFFVVDVNRSGHRSPAKNIPAGWEEAGYADALSHNAEQDAAGPPSLRSPNNGRPSWAARPRSRAVNSRSRRGADGPQGGTGEAED
jgi:hypothetical protein